MNTRKTKQREVIYGILSQLNSHPTILQIVDIVHTIDSSIGQATVYRNVSKLVDEGLVVKIPTKDGIEHYDANCNLHHHFMCKKCNKLFDLDKKMIEITFNNNYNKNFQIDNVSVLLEGICDSCK